MICMQSRGGQGGWGQGLLPSSSRLPSPLRDSAGIDRKTLWKKRRRGRERSEEEGRRESIGGGGGSEEGGLTRRRQGRAGSRYRGQSECQTPTVAGAY